MPPSLMDDGEHSLLTARRIRHIASIQVRNLTPFPARDAFTSALSHFSDVAQSSLVLTDDISVMASRRRIRTLSGTSGGSKSTLKSQDAFTDSEEHSPTTGTVRGRKTSGSKVSFTDHGSSVGSTVRGSPGRRTVRPRTTSKGSTSSIRTLSSSFPALGASTLLSGNTQRGLEMVIDSRLLETCLVVTVQEPPSRDTMPPVFSNFWSPTLAAPDIKGKASVSPCPGDSKHNPSQPLAWTRSPPTSIAMTKHTRNIASEASPLRDRVALSGGGGKHARQESASQPHHRIAPSVSRTRSKHTSLSLDLERPLPEPAVLRYISPVHRPSTNPDFVIGSQFLSQFSEWKCLNASSLHVAIWGKMPVKDQGEASTPEAPYPDVPGMHWKVLDEWNVHLDQLVPIDEETRQHDEFPSNTLLLQLMPQGCTYRLPARHIPRSRPSTPPLDCSSDLELTTHNQSQAKIHGSSSIVKGLRTRRRAVNVADEETMPKTASWPDIFQLATLQAYIADCNADLNVLTGKVDQVVREDVVFTLRRDISQRQDRLVDLQEDRHGILEASSQKRLEIQERRAALDRRRELLLEAREIQGELEDYQGVEAKTFFTERSNLLALQANLSSIRAGLVSVLADIFPIELYSSPDLLFTILDVPLPIPLSANDAAPPLSLPDHKQVNEDAIAAALGYVAEVLQLLSAYLGTSLSYPVTCVGSRSLIRDGISSMVGPRTFPLYSKGVDMYRFQYGVFLLNKNIELLMAEKDLRALDVRHTLPNLKNLLLILSHDTSGMSQFRKRKPPETPSSAILELGPDSDNMENVSTSRKSTTVESRTPPRSGATTPTPAMTNEASKSRSFLGLGPFGFLRGRYPSASGQDSSVHEDGDDEDGRTIHGVIRDESGLGGIENVGIDVQKHLEAPLPESNSPSSTAAS